MKATKRLHASLVAALLLCLVACASPPRKYVGPGTQLTAQKVAFKSGDLTLYGYLYKPAGEGPFPVLVWNHGSEKNQIAGVEYVKRLPFVDTKRIAVAGCSYGGIETLFGAEQDRDYKVAISISPGALSWEHNRYLQRMLVDSVERIDIPVLLIQPPRDASLAPSRVLGATAASAGKPLTAKIYPAAGPRQEQEHCFGGARGMHVWAEDAKAFLATNLH